MPRSNTGDAALSPFMTIVNWEVGVNLRDVGWSCRFVDKLESKYGLKDGQAVIFYNNSRFWFGEGGGNHPPKCRIYWKWNGHVLPIIPAVDAKLSRQVDAQMLLNEWLRATFNFARRMDEKSIDAMFETFTTNVQESADRRARAAEAAKKRKRNK